MQIANEFTVGADPQVVYETLLDFERVGPCIPGATVGPADAEGAHPAEIAVRLGPMKLTYRGTVRLDDRDDAERRATMLADVREARGQGSARARMSMTVTPDGTGSRVASVTDAQLTGRAAQMGGGIVQDVAERLMADMAANLERLLEGGGAAAEVPETPTPPSPSPEAEPEPEPEPAAQPSTTREPGVSIPPPGFKPETATAPTAPPAARPVGGFRLLLRALWHRLRHGRRSSATENR
jgi:carbon monoxide dehydrogenase subunit G